MIPCPEFAYYFAVTELTYYLHRLLLIYRKLAIATVCLTSGVDWGLGPSRLNINAKNA